MRTKMSSPQRVDAVRPPISSTIDDEIVVRGHNLARELLGAVSFTEMMLLDVDGSLPSPERVRMVDAVLVAMIEHGITPSTLAARLVLDGAPEAMQGAIAAGVLATGSRFLGTIEPAATLLEEVVGQADAGVGLDEAADARVAVLIDAGARVPGMGHNLHARRDPRVDVLLTLAVEHGVAGPHVAALVAVQAAARRRKGDALVANAAGAIGAILSDLGYEPREIRGFAAVARCAGIFAHVIDEQREPMAREVWTSLHEAVSGSTDGARVRAAADRRG
jgi:citrate synthase